MNVVTRASGRPITYVVAALAVAAVVLNGRAAGGEPMDGAPAPVAVVSEGSPGLDMAPMIEPMEDVAESAVVEVADLDMAPMVEPMEDVAESAVVEVADLDMAPMVEPMEDVAE